MANKTKSQKRNLFLIVLALTIADLIIVDPIPILDELALLVWTAYLGRELL